ncbi:hypothetical protein ABZP36_029339 [Zizania latifolia]
MNSSGDEEAKGAILSLGCLHMSYPAVSIDDDVVYQLGKATGRVDDGGRSQGRLWRRLLELAVLPPVEKWGSRGELHAVDERLDGCYDKEARLVLLARIDVQPGEAGGAVCQYLDGDEDIPG